MCKIDVSEFIKSAFAAVGKVMYIYGGGWNEEDSGAGKGAMTEGILPDWEKFAAKCGKDYDHKKYDAQKDKSMLLNGLDCSAYIGWVIQNTFKDGKRYVTNSGNIGNFLESLNFGHTIKNKNIKERKIGDIMFKDGHTYINLGQCADGSILIVHSSPPGVQINGIGKDAEELAKECMQKYFPEWYEKFPNVSRDNSYIGEYDCFRWTIFEDKNNISALSPKMLLKHFFTAKR